MLQEEKDSMGCMIVILVFLGVVAWVYAIGAHYKAEQREAFVATLRKIPQHAEACWEGELWIKTSKLGERLREARSIDFGTGQTVPCGEKR